MAVQRQTFTRTLTIDGSEYSYVIESDSSDNFYFRDIRTPAGFANATIELPQILFRDIFGVMTALKLGTLDVSSLTTEYLGISGVSG